MTSEQQSETRWVRDVPADPMMQNQWQQRAIPRCIAHNMGGLMIDDRCVVGKMLIDDPLSEEPDGCVISRGGPDHKWWVDV